ncbi:MAG: hypothetical protein NVS2B14_16430 [Chamaesiphon sp.]
MSRQLFKSVSQTTSFIVRSVGLSAGVGILLSSGGVLALSQSQLVAQRTPGDVVVDTNGNSGSTTSYPRSGSTIASGTRFDCESVNGQYTVMYHPESQPGQAYPWAVPGYMGDNWTPQRRCNEISRRLESYRPDGLLEMRTDVVNGYNTICVTTEQVSSCRIVLTVPRGQDPQAIRDRVFQNLTVADSGERTEGVNTFANSGSRTLNNLFKLGLPSRTFGNRSQNINLQPFLDARDGGTATHLTGGIKTRVQPGSTNHRLNPGNFR